MNKQTKIITILSIFVLLGGSLLTESFIGKGSQIINDSVPQTALSKSNQNILLSYHSYQNNEQKIIQISIKTKPTKLEYNLNDTLDITGLVVEGKLEDGSIITLDNNRLNIIPNVLDSVGTRTVVITEPSSGQTATYTVEVRNPNQKLSTSAIIAIFAISCGTFGIAIPILLNLIKKKKEK